MEQVFLDHLNDKGVQVERHKVAENLHLSPADVDDGEEFPVVVGVRCAGTYGMYLSPGFLTVRRVTLKLG